MPLDPPGPSAHGGDCRGTLPPPAPRSAHLPTAQLLRDHRCFKGPSLVIRVIRVCKGTLALNPSGSCARCQSRNAA